MNRVPALCLLAALAVGPSVASASPTAAPTAAGKKFEWTTKSPEAKKLLAELQWKIESFQFGPSNVELAKKLVAADPNFAIGQYYLSAVLPDPAEAEKAYEKSRELAAAQLQQSRDRFAAGVAGNLEVVQAQEAVALASDQYISAMVTSNLATGNLVRALGIAEEAARQLLGGPR